MILSEMFADLYRSIHIEPDAKTLKRRWQAVASYSKPRKDLFNRGVNLLALHQGLPSARSDDFVAAMKTADPTFPMKDNHQEVRFLAGVSVMAMMQSESRRNVDLALAVLAADCQRRGAGFMLPDLYTVGLNVVAAAAHRDRASFGRVDLSRARLSITEMTALDPGQVASNPVAIMTTMFEHIVELQDNIIAESNSVWEALEVLNTNAALVAEESDMLWWVYGAESRTLEVPLKAVPKLVRPVVAGWEISELIRITPGPGSVRSLIQHALASAGTKPSETLRFTTAITEFPQELSSRVADINNLIGCLPLHRAIALQKEIPGEAWVAVWQQQTGIGPDHSMNPTALGYQTFIERLLIASQNDN